MDPKWMLGGPLKALLFRCVQMTLKYMQNINSAAFLAPGGVANWTNNAQKHPKWIQNGRWGKCVQTALKCMQNINSLRAKSKYKRRYPNWSEHPMKIIEKLLANGTNIHLKSIRNQLQISSKIDAQKHQKWIQNGRLGDLGKHYFSGVYK